MKQTIQSSKNVGHRGTALKDSSHSKERAAPCNSCVLGLSFGTHDTAAALLCDGEILAAAEEERFNREKRTQEFPLNASAYCIRRYDKSPGIIALPYGTKEALASLLRIVAHPAPLGNRTQQIMHVVRTLNRVLSSKRRLKREGLVSEKTALALYEHHRAHAALAFYGSGFPSALVVTVDGVGESKTGAIFHGSAGVLEQVEAIRFPNSLGKAYGAICRYLGFWGPSKEGKVMGLAAYGTPSLLSSFEGIVNIPTEGVPTVNQSWFRFGLTPSHPSIVSEEFIRTFGSARQATQAIEQHHMDVAHCFQIILERALVSLLRYAKRIVEENSLCLAGGVAVNCQAVSKIRKSGLFDKIYVPPAAHDAGLAIGSAYLAAKELGHTLKPLSSAFLGPEYSDSSITAAASSLNVQCQSVECPPQMAAEMLNKGCVIGWFQGRLEYGARALGNRSILADPRCEESRRVVNEVIKSRETFRPFAPAVLCDYAEQVFDLPADIPYMTETVRVREEWRKRIPAVVHCDGTARVQTVRRQDNQMFYDLINYFYKLTEIPLVLNTSFNRQGEPLYNRPEEAIRMFCESRLDFLFAGSYVFRK